jgi:hypothetical protein
MSTQRCAREVNHGGAYSAQGLPTEVVEGLAPADESFFGLLAASAGTRSPSAAANDAELAASLVSCFGE